MLPQGGGGNFTDHLRAKRGGGHFGVKWSLCVCLDIGNAPPPPKKRWGPVLFCVSLTIFPIGTSTRHPCREFGPQRPTTASSASSVHSAKAHMLQVAFLTRMRFFSQGWAVKGTSPRWLWCNGRSKAFGWKVGRLGRVTCLRQAATQRAGRSLLEEATSLVCQSAKINGPSK